MTACCRWISTAVLHKKKHETCLFTSQMNYCHKSQDYHLWFSTNFLLNLKNLQFILSSRIYILTKLTNYIFSFNNKKIKRLKILIISFYWEHTVEFNKFVILTIFVYIFIIISVWYIIWRGINTFTPKNAFIQLQTH